MSNPYGPWATLIDVGRNPQLSAFWRRRLTLLVPTSMSSAVLSRGNLLGLAMAGVLLGLLPTLRLAPVAAQENPPSRETSPAKPPAETEQGGLSKSRVGVGVVTAPDANAVRADSVGVVTVNANAAEGGNAPSTEADRYTVAILAPGNEFSFPDLDRSLAFGFYMPLSASRIRKELNLSGEQEAKLREIHAKQVAEEQRQRPELQAKMKEVDKLPPQEQTDKIRELLVQRLPSVRKQVERGAHRRSTGSAKAHHALPGSRFRMGAGRLLV